MDFQKRDWAIELAEKHSSTLDPKRPQTTYKIKYVSTYVEKWLYVMAHNNPPAINFIDCMCNAGIYRDGDIGTSMLVLELFIKVAKAHENIKFNLFLNDKNKDRLDIIQEIINKFHTTKLKNLAIHIENKDVNDYLSDTNYFSGNCKSFGSATLLFVDPYDFGTVKKQSLIAFLKEYYCELFFNLFTSDFIRNSKDEQNNKKIIECWGNEVAQIKTNDEFVNYIRNELKVGNIKNTFAYAFRIMTNAEIYQILFFTPHIRGLEKIKEAYWDIFKGKEVHRNEQENTSGQVQVSFFTEQDDEKNRLEQRSKSARNLLLTQFKNIEDDYSVFATYLLENTMLTKDHLLKNVFKPLISEGKIIKRNITSKQNFTNDKYFIKGIKQ